MVLGVCVVRSRNPRYHVLRVAICGRNDIIGDRIARRVRSELESRWSDQVKSVEIGFLAACRLGVLPPLSQPPSCAREV